MAEPGGGREPTPFWRFSLDYYGRPGVAAACLKLQDSQGADVNLVLLALWLGTSGYRLDERLGLALQRVARRWQQPLITPLRSVRRRLKRRLAVLDPGTAEELAGLRGQLASLEMALERCEQEALERLVGTVGEGSGDREATLANLAALGLGGLAGSQELAVLLDAVFSPGSTLPGHAPG